MEESPAGEKRKKNRNKQTKTLGMISSPLLILKMGKLSLWEVNQHAQVHITLTAL